ncbi:MAG: single-stranded DNA-binding protein [bacterium]|nr:single-stranded DNA-binding protein [bacterium]
MNLNKAFIIGNLTRDPELRTLPSGASLATFGVATNRTWKNQSGEKQEDTQFHNIVLFGRQAEIAQQYLTKGSSVFIEGRIQTRVWDAQDGSKKSKTEIVAEKMQLGPRRAGGQGGQPQQPPQAGGEKSGGGQKEELETIEYPNEEINPEEIPF